MKESKKKTKEDWLDKDLEEAEQEVARWPEWMSNLKNSSGEPELELSAASKKAAQEEKKGKSLKV
jgi:hypothetical protein